MAEAFAVHPMSLAHAEDEPIIFYGPPEQVQGNLRLHNTSSEKVKLASVSFEAPNVQGPGRVPLRQVQLGARFYPNEQAQVSASMQLDPTTPPGIYEGNIQIGTRRQPVRVHVTEKIDIRVDPRHITIYTEGEHVFRREFVAENAGNVPVPLGGKCLVPLIDAMEFRTAIRHGLEGACDAETENIIKSLLCAWSEQQVGPMSVTRDEVTLQPGEIRPMVITFTLPENIRHFRQYSADMLVYTAPVRLDVTTGELPKPSGREKRRER